MKYTEIIYLIPKILKKDLIGNEYYEDGPKVKSYAYMQKVGINEFYNAVSQGMRVSYEFKIRMSNYHNEEKIEFNNEILDVIRVIPYKTTKEIVLVVGQKIGSY